MIERLRRETAVAVEGRELQALEEVHVLDLAADGLIKPHIDSIKVRVHLNCSLPDYYLSRTQIPFSVSYRGWGEGHWDSISDIVQF